jgi:hypothetical protein
MSIIGDHLTDDSCRGMYDKPEKQMASYHNYIVIIGRAHGDDEDHARTYGDMTEVQARQAFINDVRRDEGIPEVDVVAGYEYTNVYITHFITSQSPINVESSQ